MGAAQTAQSGSSANTAINQNLTIRKNIVKKSVNMLQLIKTTTITNFVNGAYYPVQFQLNNVGLNKRIYLQCIFTVVQGASETQYKTPLGPANIFSNIQLTDLANFVRIQTSGWHLHFLASARRRRPFGSAFTNSDPCNFGNNFNVINCPQNVTTSKTGYMLYEVPLAYSDHDLRGAIYANVTGGAWYLQVTINPNFFVTSTADPTFGVFQSSSAQLGTLSSLQINVYQEYLDQLPSVNGQIQLPQLDLGVAYMLQTATWNGLAVGSDFTIPYANYRNFMSTMMIFDNGGTLNNGSDINYIELQNANLTNIFKYDPQLNALLTREKVQADFPIGCYYFDHRAKPITTNQFGNMQLVVNPSTVNAGANLYMAYESLGLIGQVLQGGAIGSGG